MIRTDGRPTIACGAAIERAIAGTSTARTIDAVRRAEAVQALEADPDSGNAGDYPYRDSVDDVEPEWLARWGAVSPQSRAPEVQS